MCLTDVLSFNEVADLYNRPVYLTIEFTAQTLSHMTKMGVLIFYLTEISMLAEIFIGRERSTETQRLSYRHITFDTLTCRCSGEDSHTKLFATLMEFTGTFRQFTERRLRTTRRSEARQSQHLLIFNH